MCGCIRQSAGIVYTGMAVGIDQNMVFAARQSADSPQIGLIARRKYNRAVHLEEIAQLSFHARLIAVSAVRLPPSRRC